MKVAYNILNNRLDANNALKRNSHYDVALDELGECIQTKETIDITAAGLPDMIWKM